MADVNGLEEENGSILLSLPMELLENIVLCLSYDEIARLRLVCVAFDKLCQGLLNKGFLTVEKYHGKCHRNVKALLPRRESERRTHPMARHCDIFNAVETRLSLLNMTFIKYMDMKLCCFIPGKVIDEIYRILNILKEKTPPRAHEILQELRDISSMAMEHFDERIVPILKQKMMSPAHIGQSSTSTVSLPSFMGIPVSGQRDGQLSKWIQPGLLKLHHLNKKNCATLIAMKKQHDTNKLKITEIEKKMQEQEKTILELNHVITDQQEQISELSKKFVDYDKKFKDTFAAVAAGKKPATAVAGSTVFSDGTKSVAISAIPEQPEEVTSGVTTRVRLARKAKTCVNSTAGNPVASPSRVTRKRVVVESKMVSAKKTRSS